MRIFTVLLILLTASPVWATSLTWQYSGTNVTGTFTYDSEASPNGYNVRGRDPNVTYALTSWDFTFTHQWSAPSLAGLPSSFTFSNTLANNTAEFCIGECIFSNDHFERLFFSNGQQSLQLTFPIPSLDPFLTAPPNALTDWGTLNPNASWFKSFDAAGNFQTMSMFTGGAITGVSSSPLAQETQSVPEPSTWLLLLGGLLGVAGWKKWRTTKEG